MASVALGHFRLCLCHCPPPPQVEDVELVDRKGYLTISIAVAKEGKIQLRKPEGTREWFDALNVSSSWS